MSYTVLDSSRQQLGPMSEEEVRERLKNGSVTLENLAWKPGMAEWQPLRAFTEFIDVPNTPSAQVAFNPYAPPQVEQYFPVGVGSQDMNAPSSVRGRALTEEVLRRDYRVDIFHCLGRGWDLVFSRDFWPIVGVSALTWLTLVASSMCYANIVIGGPISGGVDLYFLKKIRGEDATLNTAFSGFNIAFSQLFLVYLIAALMCSLGFVLCIIPGIYLAVAYTFGRALVIDKRLEFWDAMECSRKVVTKNWFSIFGLMIVGGLFMMLGVVALLIGVFVTMPIFNAALMYAYEDIFNPKTGTGHESGV